MDKLVMRHVTSTALLFDFYKLESRKAQDFGTAVQRSYSSDKSDAAVSVSTTR